MGRITTVLVFIVLIFALAGSIYWGVSTSQSQSTQIDQLKMEIETNRIDYDKKIKTIDSLLKKIKEVSKVLEESEKNQADLVVEISEIKFKTTKELEAKYAAQHMVMVAEIAKLKKEKPTEVEKVEKKELEMKLDLCLQEKTDLRVSLNLCNDKVKKYSELEQEFEKYKKIFNNGKSDYTNLVIISKELYSNIRTERDILSKSNVTLSLDLDKTKKKARFWRSVGIGAVVGGLVLILSTR